MVWAPSAYNAILGYLGLNELQAVVSTYHLKIKFATKFRVGEVWGDSDSATPSYFVMWHLLKYTLLMDWTPMMS